MPSNLKKIESYTFEGCKKLQEITIPSTVYYIGIEAFSDCIACESIVIPASVYKIGKFAFRNFSGCKGTVTFEVYSGWKLYGESDKYFEDVRFEDDRDTPALLLTYVYADYAWKRD